MELKQPLVSIIMPAYNCEKFIRQSLESILNQTYSNIEILICDDASKDKTKKIIDNYTDSRIKRFHNATNLGYLKTWNKLMKHAKGDYITFQDADDYSDLERIGILINEFKKDSHLGAVGSNYIRVDDKGNFNSTSNFSIELAEILRKIPDQFDIIGSGLMIKKEVYQKIGGYNEFFDRIGAEDYYWFCLISEKFNFRNIKKALYYYRYNPNSVSGEWSDNIKKMATAKILNFLINQRKIEKTDYLETKRMELLYNKMDELLHPYYVDKSLFYRELSIKYFYENQKKRALSLAWRAFIKKPHKTENIKNLIYFLRKWH
jgi:glycosyltransferase involved in cell wall biosynthesis